MNERVRELDGVRGISIIVVVAFHLLKRADYFTSNETLHFITRLSSIGWVGVDIFFVLSGFLITSILLRTKHEKNYFKNFYVRRSLRIFPLYFVFIAVILLLLPKLDPDFTPEIPRALPFLLLYQQNWLMLISKIPLTTYLAVTWSLAIEEQFYLIWPAVVYFTKKETLIKLSIGVILFSILARLLGILFWDDMSQVSTFFYYNTFTRFEQLVFGGLLAIAFTEPLWIQRLKNISIPSFWVAFTAFLALCFTAYPHMVPLDENIWLVFGGYTLAAVFSAALVTILMTHPETSMFRRLFQNKLLIFFGKYSYSIYLLHVPVILILLDMLWRTQLRGWTMYLAYMVLTYIITVVGALITWNLLEKHMLNLKKYFEYQ